MDDDPSNMERLRADLIRRARIERYGEIYAQQTPELLPPAPPRRPFPRLFRRNQQPPSARELYRIDIESPKSPEIDQGVNSSSRGFQFPNFARPWTARSQDPRNRPETLSEMTQFNRPFTAPSSTTAPARVHQRPLRERDANNNSNDSQASAGTEASRRSQRRSGDHRVDQPHRCARHTKRFMLCLPWIRSRKVRKQVIACFVSGLILILLIAVCT